MVKKDKLLQDYDLIREEFNVFFKNIASILNVNENTLITNSTLDDTTDLMEKAIEKYKIQPSIILIEKRFEYSNIFPSETVEISDSENK